MVNEVTDPFGKKRMKKITKIKRKKLRKHYKNGFMSAFQYGVKLVSYYL